MIIFNSLKKELLQKYPNRVFIETGSQYGHGIEVALACDFEKIYSIDIDSKYHAHCSQRFAEHVESGKLELFIGDSAQKLKEILALVNEPVTFWLDAHGGLGGKGTLCPAIPELEQIKHHNINTHTILVDDRRMFGQYWGVGTSEEDVIELIKEINPLYEISYANGSEPKDIIVAALPNV
jgi:hypothetical protein